MDAALFYLTATGKFAGLDADQVGGVFNEMLSQPLVMAFWMIVVVAIGIFVCSEVCRMVWKNHKSNDDCTACHHGSAGD